MIHSSSSFKFVWFGNFLLMMCWPSLGRLDIQIWSARVENLNKTLIVLNHILKTYLSINYCYLIVRFTKLHHLTTPIPSLR